jgi:cell division protein FtsI/penicillin-binding protein 2
VAALANGGVILRPHLLLESDPPGAEAADRADYVVGRLDLPPDTLRAVREGMRRVTGPQGTARGQFKPGWRVAAKTGTAETGDPQVNNAWIAGYAPWDAPRYAFAVVIHKTPGHGGEVAGPVAAEALGGLFHSDTP